MLFFCFSLRYALLASEKIDALQREMTNTAEEIKERRTTMCAQLVATERQRIAEVVLFVVVICNINSHIFLTEVA